MSIKGFSTSEKILESVQGVPSEYTDSRANFVTLQEDRNNRVLLDVSNKSVFKILGNVEITGECTRRKIVAENHGAKKGDLIRFVSGSNNYHEFNVKHIISSNEFVIEGRMQNIPSIGDKFDVFVYFTPIVGAGGAQPVDVISSVLPTGAATSALQIAGNDILTNIYNQFLPLATSALQTTGNNILSDIKTKLNLTSIGYFFKNLDNEPILVSSPENIILPYPVRLVNITNNSGFIFSLSSTVNNYSLIIAPGLNDTIPFICNDNVSEHFILASESDVDADSGNIFINFIGVI